MAYAVKYTGTFDDTEGATYTADILEDGFAGSATTVDWASRPIEITWGRQGGDIYDPIIASEARARLFDHPDGTIGDDLASGFEDDFRLKVTKGAQVKWYGPIIADGIHTSTDKIKKVTRFRAIDGLGSLSGIDFGDGIGNLLTGRETVVSIVSTIIGKLDLADTVDTIYTACDWYENSMSSSDPLDQVEVERSIFSDDADEPFVCREVLEQLLTAFGLQIYQWDGAWHIVQRELVDATYTRTEYDSTGTLIASASYDPVVTISSSDQYDDRLAGGQRQERQPYKETILGYAYDIQQILENGGFEEWPGNVPEEWTNNGLSIDEFVGAGTEVAPRSGGASLEISDITTNDYSQGTDSLSNYISQTTDEIVAGSSNKVSFTASAYAHSLIDRPPVEPVQIWAQVILHGSSDDHYLNNDGSWTTSAAYIGWGQPETPGGLPWGIPVNMGWSTLNVGSENLPEDGTVEVRFYEINDPNEFGGFPVVDQIYIDDVDVTFLPSGTGENVRTTRTATLLSSEAVRIRDEETLIFGDGPDGHPRRLTVSGGDTASWGRTSSGPFPDALHTLLVKSWFKAQDRHLQSHVNGYFQRDLGINETLEVAGIPMAPVHLSKQLKESRDTGEWVEVHLQGSDPGVELVDERAEQFRSSSNGRTFEHVVQSKNVVNTSNSNALTTTRTAISSGSTTSIPINAIGEPVLNSGDQVVIIDKWDATFHTLTLSADQAPSDTTLTINSYTFDYEIPVGSGVYRKESELLSTIVQTPYIIEMAVRGDKIGDLGTAISSGNTVTALDMGARGVLGVPRSGEKIYIEESGSREQYEVATTPSFGDGSLDVVDKTASNSFTTAATVHYDGGHNLIESVFNITPGQITLDANLISIDGTTTFTSGYDPSTKAEESDVSVVIRDPGTGDSPSDGPSQRPNGSSLREGDVWVDTDNGDKPHTWDGSNWIRAYTIIDGGDLITGTVTANKLNIGQVSDISSDAGTLTGGSAGGWTLTSSEIRSGTDIILSNASKQISINSTTFGNQGIQLDYNGGTPRFYVGDGTVNNFFQFDGSTVSWSGEAKEVDIVDTQNITTGDIVVGTTSDGIVMDSTNLRGVSGGTTQFSLRVSDGKAVAGGGNVTLDTDGITLTAGSFTSNEVTWSDGSSIWSASGVVNINSNAGGRLQLDNALLFDGVDIDMFGNVILDTNRVQFRGQTGYPNSDGDMFYNSDDNELYFRIGSTLYSLDKTAI